MTPLKNGSVLSFQVFNSFDSTAKAQRAQHPKNLHEENTHPSSNQVYEMMLHKLGQLFGTSLSI